MKADKARLERALEQVVAQLREMGARRIILFGSLARDQVRVGSDVDILALFDDDRGFKERMWHIYSHLETDEDVDVLAYNFDQFERVQHRPFFRHVLQEGKVIYET